MSFRIEKEHLDEKRDEKRQETAAAYPNSAARREKNPSGPRNQQTFASTESRH